MKKLRESYQDLLWQFMFKPIAARLNASQAAQIAELSARVAGLENRLLIIIATDGMRLTTWRTIW